MNIDNNFEINLVDKKTNETIVSTTGTMSSIESEKRITVPKVLEIENIAGNEKLFNQLSDIEEGTFLIELEGIPAGKYNLLKGQDVINLVEVLENN